MEETPKNEETQIRVSRLAVVAFISDSADKPRFME
jgi:hypothetical protein